MTDMTVKYLIDGVMHYMRIAQDDFEQWLDENPDAVLAEIVYDQTISQKNKKTYKKCLTIT